MDDDVPKDVQIVLEKVLKAVEGDVLEIEAVLGEEVPTFDANMISFLR